MRQLFYFRFFIIPSVILWKISFGSDYTSSFGLLLYCFYRNPFPFMSVCFWFPFFACKIPLIWFSRWLFVSGFRYPKLVFCWESFSFIFFCCGGSKKIAFMLLPSSSSDFWRFFWPSCFKNNFRWIYWNRFFFWESFILVSTFCILIRLSNKKTIRLPIIRISFIYVFYWLISFCFFGIDSLCHSFFFYSCNCFFSKTQNILFCLRFFMPSIFW